MSDLQYLASRDTIHRLCGHIGVQAAMKICKENGIIREKCQVSHVSQRYLMFCASGSEKRVGYMKNTRMDKRRIANCTS